MYQVTGYKMRKLVKILFLTFGVIAAFILNYYFIENLIIPDPYYYHNRDAGFLFDMFYDKPTANGVHPYPTVFNFIVTVGAGLLLGLNVYKFYVLKRQQLPDMDKQSSNGH